eukprot:TRINITY_DN7999_c0_g1_i1.p1 TRINITY_DN7999_c0_g1~~TRINITY_DN7999_c0_g1_i1.p1  ORF type:complete len:842 (-),score=130.49 TRINITY_DN7999_c0_g1_i1:22-2547(-)
MSVVLMVAEKPSIARTLAYTLSGAESVRDRKGISPMCPVHEYKGKFSGKPAQFRVTSVVGHIFSCDFYPEFQNWNTTDPKDLFAAPTRKVESTPKARIIKHLKNEAKGVDFLVLWLDCDREGENICFEVIDVALPKMNKRKGKTIFRSHFSSLTAPDLHRAMNNLGEPNENESEGVEARQELDLKVGVAFTRFQTRYFQGKYGDLDSSLISYGPCQTPTLGFCVSRYDMIQKFEPEKFWTVDVTLVKGISNIDLKWQRKRVFDQAVGTVFTNKVANAARVKTVSSNVKVQSKGRPAPLNTTTLMKIASKQLGMGPHHAMHIAEALYIQGYISYPRTETTKYSEHFDLTTVLSSQTRHPSWGEYVTQLLVDGFSRPKGGSDAGDHPPITPMRMADTSDLAGDHYRLYDYICRHFIATVSPPCKYAKLRATFEIGGETFTYSGKKALEPGFTVLMPWLAVQDSGISDLQLFNTGGDFTLHSATIREGVTSPPDFLTESELIGQMEKNGIGTDASIAVHINNICQRNYVQVTGGRKLMPTKLGVALVHGYKRIDADLVEPTVRASVEQSVDFIAQGKAGREYVTSHLLTIFEAKFRYFVSTIAKMDEYFEGSFSALSKTVSKLRTKCGNCRKYMNYLPLKPSRLYCPTCEETYSLPHDGKIKRNKELLCPLDGFELLLCQMGEMTFSLCPNCYNNPALEGMNEGSGCNRCPHPKCKQSMVANSVLDCPQCESGKIVLDVNSFPKWKMDCNHCNYVIYLPEKAHKIATTDDKCESCETRLIMVDFNRNNTPLPNGETKRVGCVKCDEILNANVKDGVNRLRNRRGGYRKRKGKRGRKKALIIIEK